MKRRTRRAYRINRNKGSHKSFVRGLKNENRFYGLMLRLVDLLKEKYPKKIFYGTCSQSGSSYIQHGTIDLQDKSGQDITIILEGNSEKPCSVRHVLIYDVKSSLSATEEFNKNIRLYPGQICASLKKAITVNNNRSDREIVEEVLNDLILLSFISPEAIIKISWVFRG